MKKLMLTASLFAALTHTHTFAKQVYVKLEDAKGNPIANTLVKLRGTDVEATSNHQGILEFDTPEGTYILDVKSDFQSHFHQSITVDDSLDTSLDNPYVVSLTSDSEHKLVITANPLEHTVLDMATPATLLAGDELVRKRAATLGEILQAEPGLNVSSFGPAVSRPVIRGLSGSRVTITNNQMTVQDASTASADHDLGIEPILAEQIEVIKGPATLLYGSGAIGGVVNTTDRKINPNQLEDVSGAFELRFGNNATNETTAIFALDGGNEDWNWHIDAFSKSNDDLIIPSYAESEALREHEEEHHEEELHEEEHHEEDNHEEDHGEFGILESSASEARGGSVGATLLTEKGYWGLSLNHIDKNYGVPGHAHHGEEEHQEEEEHEEEHHEEEHQEEEHHDEGVTIDMKQTRFDFQTKHENLFAGAEQFFAGLSYTDYEHVELEGEEIGTRFTNEALEFRTWIKHDSWDGWNGVIGAQISSRDFAAIGEEAVVPESDTNNRAVFWLEEKHFDKLKWELGARLESQSISALGFESKSENGFSFSSGIVYKLREHNLVAVNFSHANRFPSAEEYFSFGPHIATRTFDIGNQDLTKETSNNLDLSYRFEFEKITGEINLFFNRFNDFIFADVVSESDPCASHEAAHEAEEGELSLTCYKQADADHRGMEFQVAFPIAQVGQHQFTGEVFGDWVNAELKNGDYLPRIPANKLGLVLNYEHVNLSSHLSWIKYQAQNDISENEFATPGFKQLDLEVAYRLNYNQDQLYLFIKGKNLLDEEARDHSSFIKDLAPRVGRNLTMGVRYSF